MMAPRPSHLTGGAASIAPGGPHGSQARRTHETRRLRQPRHPVGTASGLCPPYRADAFPVFPPSMAVTRE